jgi:hypothetical protein
MLGFEILASQGPPPVSMTPAANFATKFATGVNDTSGKFAGCVNNTGGKMKLPPVSTTLIANNWNNMRLLGQQLLSLVDNN